MLVGIDPGQKTGVAVYIEGALCALYTTSQLGMISFLRIEKPSRVIFEDSRLQSVVFGRGQGQAAMLKIARNVGEIDAWCKLIVDVCGDLGIPAHGISPKSKGAKLDAQKFKAVTGWQGSSNQHERDSAMIAWPYRGAGCDAVRRIAEAK